MGIGRISLACLIAWPCFADFADTRTIGHTLWEDPVVLVNAQGWAQQDLSIRGSGYTGAGISLNGLTLKSPYSAHYNSELPFLQHLLTAPQTRAGLQNVSGHLIGTAAYNTVPQAARLQARAGVGTKEHYQATILGGTDSVGGFVDWEKARRIDDNANDLDRMAGGAHTQHFHNDWQLDLIGAHQQKEFGTLGYYGVGTGDQTLDDSLVFLGATKGDLDDSFIRASSALRQMDLDETDSRYGAVMLEGRTLEIQHIALNLRGDVENEYAEGRDRTRGSVVILPEARFERFTVSAGLNSVFQTSESAEFLPLAGIDWFATDNSTVYAAYSENVQQPDYQTLANNPLLQQQKTQNSELGFRQFASASLDWRAAAFHRRLDNASDWIGGTAATDLGTLNVTGLESEVSYYPSAALELRAFYQWVHKDNNATDGFYELDYPEHLLNVSGQWQFASEFVLFAAQTLRYQTDNDARTSSNFGADASVGLHYFPRFANNARLSFLVDNLWDTDFQALPGLKPPGRTVSTGITVGW